MDKEKRKKISLKEKEARIFLNLFEGADKAQRKYFGEDLYRKLLSDRSLTTFDNDINIIFNR